LCLATERISLPRIAVKSRRRFGEQISFAKRKAKSMIAILSATHSPARTLLLAMVASQAVVGACGHRPTHKPSSQRTDRAGQGSFLLSRQGPFKRASGAADPAAARHASWLIEDHRQIACRDTSAALLLCHLGQVSGQIFPKDNFSVAVCANRSAPVKTQLTIRSRGPPTAR
jgi:hypothetical protein